MLASSELMGLLNYNEEKVVMIQGTFYFIDDRFYSDFPDSKLMHNKQSEEGKDHDRPCFFAFEDDKTGLFWMIPFSSKIDKFKELHRKKVEKYGKCDTILFGDVLGHEKAFLIQNMFPVTNNYIKHQYVDRGGVVVKVDGAFEADLIKTAKEVLIKVRKGVNLIFTDVSAIEEKLLKKNEDTE